MDIILEFWLSVLLPVYTLFYPLYEYNHKITGEVLTNFDVVINKVIDIEYFYLTKRKGS